MTKFTEMPLKAQVMFVAGVVLGLSISAYFFLYKDRVEANKTAQQALDAKLAENDTLRPYEPKLQEMTRQIALLKDQLEIQKRIVPDEKEADQFMRLMQDTAATAGIEVRRYTAKNVQQRDFFTEAPFELELDGPYYSMLNFFERVGKLERIINVEGLKVASLKRAKDAGASKTYQYGSGESVVATFVATAFFSHDLKADAPPPPPAKKK
jgi:type IV pilus assembly protein PilO